MSATSGQPRIGVTALLAAVLTIGSPDGVASQARDSLTLTLQDALQMAIQSNPARRRASNDLDINGPETRNAWFSGVVPRVSTTILTTGYDGTLQRTGVNNLGEIIESSSSEWTYRSNTDQGLNLSWQIQGASIFNRLDQQEVSNLGRTLSLESTDWTLQAQVRRQFHDVLEQLELLELEEGNLAARQVDLQSAERLFSLALNTRVDVLQAELQVQQEEGAIQQQRRGYEQALLTLRTALGDPDLPPFRVAPRPLPIFDPAGLDEAALVEQALGSHPSVRVAQSNLRGAEVTRSQRSQTIWPQINLSYQLSRSARTPEASALFDVTHDENDLYNSFGISISLPYFNDFFQNRLSDAQAEVAVHNQQEALRETRLQTEQDVRSQIIELRNQYQTLQYRERAVVIAEEALRLAREEYRLGTRTFTDLQQTIDQEVSAGRDVILTRFLLYDALVNLEEAVGAFVPIPAPIGNGAGGDDREN